MVHGSNDLVTDVRRGSLTSLVDVQRNEGRRLPLRQSSVDSVVDYANNKPNPLPHTSPLLLNETRVR